jgi:hypothetical protein
MLSQRAPCSVNVEILQAISYGEILGSRGSVLGCLGSHTILGSSGASSLLTQNRRASCFVPTAAHPKQEGLFSLLFCSYGC